VKDSPNHSPLKDPEPILPKSILIVRLSSLGDTVHSLPLAHAIKTLSPDSHLSWVTEEAQAPLIRGNPLIDSPFVVKKGFLRHPSEILSLRRSLKAKRFQLSFDPQSLTKSALVAYLSGCPKRIGFARGEGRELAPFLNNILVSPTSIHVVEKTLELLKGVGLSPPAGAKLVLPTPNQEELNLIDDFLQKNSIEKNSYFLFAPGSAQASKRWSVERYAALGDKLNQSINKSVIYISHDELERKEIELTLSKREGQFLAPDLSLLGAALLIKGSYLAVGSDSFATHVASLFALPTVMLFSVSDPRRVGPLHPNGRSVYAKLTIVGSAKARKKLGNENIMALSVDEVEGAIMGLVRQIEGKDE
jgi:ADP-heptose:LPS heptosyltransferase